MTIRATVTLNEDNYTYLQTVASNNRSAYINFLIEEDKKRTLKARVEQANIEEAEDAEYQQELSLWNNAIKDGLD